MKIAFYGSSLLSSYWNGAATYYRGMIKALAGRGYHTTFYEPRAFGRQERADIDPPSWCDVVVYPSPAPAARKLRLRAIRDRGRKAPSCCRNHFTPATVQTCTEQKNVLPLNSLRSGDSAWRLI